MLTALQPASSAGALMIGAASSFCRPLRDTLILEEHVRRSGPVISIYRSAVSRFVASPEHSNAEFRNTSALRLGPGASVCTKFPDLRPAPGGYGNGRVYHGLEKLNVPPGGSFQAFPSSLRVPPRTRLCFTAVGLGSNPNCPA